MLRNGRIIPLILLLFFTASAQTNSNAQKSNNLTRTYRGYVAGVIEGESDYDFHVVSGQINVSGSFAKNVASRIMGRPISSSEDFRYLQGSTVEVTLGNVYVYRGSGQHNVSGKLLKVVVLTIKQSKHPSQSIDAEGRAQAAKYWNKYLIKCGTSYFYSPNDYVTEQFKDTPRFYLNGGPLQPRRLSRADQLNGVDPLPVEWQAESLVEFDAVREIRREGARYWQTGANTRWHVTIRRVKGRWDVPTAREINCSQMRGLW